MICITPTMNAGGMRRVVAVDDGVSLSGIDDKPGDRDPGPAFATS